jgi:hypothetical protein
VISTRTRGMDEVSVKLLKKALERIFKDEGVPILTLFVIKLDILRNIVSRNMVIRKGMQL